MTCAGAHILTARTIDVAKLKAGFRAAAQKRGIDPINGATTYQAANVQADINKREHWSRVKAEGKWWTKPQMWLVPRSYESSANSQWVEIDGELVYKPPHKQGHLIRNLEDKVLEQIFWQALNLTTQGVEVELRPFKQMAVLFKEVLQEMRKEDRARIPLREIHHRQGFELQWILTRHGTTKLSIVEWRKTA